MPSSLSVQLLELSGPPVSARAWQMNGTLDFGLGLLGHGLVGAQGLGGMQSGFSLYRPEAGLSLSLDTAMPMRSNNKGYI